MDNPSGKSTGQIWAIALLFGLIFLVGGGLTCWEVRLTKTSMEEATLREAQMIAALIDPQRVARLKGTAADLNSPDYQLLREQLVRIREVNPRYRYLYLMGQFPAAPPFFFMGTAPPAAPDYSPPGQPYPENPPSLARVFAEKRARVSPPVTDRWGTWVSALIPILHPDTGALMAVFGADIDAAEWRNRILFRAMMPIALTIVAALFLSALLLFVHYRYSQEENRLLTHKARETQALVESLQREIKARQKAETDSARSLKLVEDVLDAASEVAIIASDREGAITLFNAGAERMLGYTAAEVVGKCTPLIFHDEREIVERAGELANKLGRPIEGMEVFLSIPEAVGVENREWSYVRKDGARLTVSLVVTPIYRDDGEIVGYLGIATDISARKTAQNALLYEKQFSERLLDSLPGIFYLYDSDLRLRRWNRNHETALGYTADELRGWYLGDWHPDDADSAKGVETVRQVLRDGAMMQMEAPLLHRNGTAIPYLLTSARLDTPGGPMMMGVGIDISARLKSEAALRQSEDFFRQMMEQSPFSISVFSSAGQLLQTNAAHQALWGVALEQARGYNLFEDPQMEQLGLMPLLDRVFAGERITTPEVEYDLSATLGAGARRVVVGDFYPIYDVDGALREVILVHQDVTDRRRAQQALLDSERQFRAVFDNAPYAIALHDWETGYYLDVNKAFMHNTGKTKEELLALRARDVVGMDDELVQQVRTALSQSGVLRDLESRVINKDGMAADIVYSLVLLEVQGKRRILSVSEDVTQKRRAEQALRESEQRLRDIGDNLPGGMIYQIIHQHDRTTRFSYLSAGVKQLHGCTAAEAMADASLLYNQIIPEDAARMAREEQDALNALSVFDVELRFRHPSGELRWFRIISQPRRTENGDIIANGIELDITDRKEIENKLLESERRYAHALAAATDAIWEWDAVSGKTYFSPRWYEMLGYGDREFPMTFDAWKDLTYPDDFEKAFASLQETLEHPGTTAYQAEFRARTKDGAWKWILSRGKVITYDAQGRPALLSGTHTDITERKHAEILLTESRQLLRNVLDTVPARVFWKDLQLRYLGCNKAFAEDAGFQRPEDLIKKNDFQMVWRKQAEAYRADDRAVIESGTSKLFFEEPQNTPDGKTIWLRTSKIPLRNAEGAVIGILGAYEDITDRKHAEEQVLREKRFSESILESLPGVFYLYDDQMNLLRWNRNHETLTGYSGSELKRLHPPQDWFAEQDWQRVMNTIAGALQGHEALVDVPLRMKDGRYIPYQLSATLFETDGKRMFMGVGLDVSDRARAEEALRQAHAGLELKVQQRTAELRISEERFRTLFTASNDAVLVLDGNRFRDCNEAALRLFNCSKAEIFLNKHPAELSPPKQPCGTPSITLADRQIERAFQEGRNFFEWVHRRLDGSDFPCEVLLSPMTLDGHPVLQTVIRDITERKQAQAALEQAKARLEAANRELEAFSYSVSHDLRAPLRAIDGFSLALLEDYGDRLGDDGMDYLRRVRKGAQRMGTLIDDMLTLSRLTRGDLRIENVDLSALAAQILDELRNGEPDRDVTCEIQPGIAVQGDPRMLSAVMANLLGNAWKFTGKRPQARIASVLPSFKWAEPVRL